MPEFHTFDATWWFLFLLCCGALVAALVARSWRKADEAKEEAIRQKIARQLSPQREKGRPAPRRQT